MNLRSDTNTWEIPCETTELGETLEETVARELKEETNLDCSSFTLLNVFSGKDFYFKYPNGDELYSVVALYLAKPVQNENYKFEIIDKDIQSLYKYKEFPNALQYDYDSKRPEVLATIAFDDAKVIGIACASADSEVMWQIGVDVLPKYRGRKIAVKLVNMLTLEILNNYKAIPYYTTDCSNISSQKVAIKSGYIPAWSHCFKTRLPKIIIDKLHIKR